MHFWGLTIDTVTTILLVLAVGLAVDYASHIAHSFMVTAGSRQGEMNYMYVNKYIQLSSVARNTKSCNNPFL